METQFHSMEKTQFAGCKGAMVIIHIILRYIITYYYKTAGASKSLKAND